MSASNASAVKFPSKKSRYMSKPLQVCDQGVFYVGGAPKTTTFHAGPTPGANRSIIIGQMYVAVPDPHEGQGVAAHHGARLRLYGCLRQGTAGGKEGWSDYTVRHGIPTYVVDQPGRARSGFDQPFCTKRNT